MQSDLGRGDGDREMVGDLAMGPAVDIFEDDH